MQAEKVKEKIKQRIEKHKRFMADANRADIHGQYEYALHMLQNMKYEIAEAETAEQEGWKELPLCNEERGKLIGSLIDPCTWYEPDFCVFYKRFGEEAHGRCACATEPAEDSEPDTELERHWHERAEHFTGKLSDHHKIYERMGALNRRVKKLEKLNGDHIEHHFKNAKTDTAFSEQLKGYLERIEKVEAKIDTVIGNHIHHLKMHKKQEQAKIDRWEADQIEKVEREAEKS